MKHEISVKSCLSYITITHVLHGSGQHPYFQSLGYLSSQNSQNSLQNQFESLHCQKLAGWCSLSMLLIKHLCYNFVFSSSTQPSVDHPKMTTGFEIQFSCQCCLSSHLKSFWNPSPPSSARSVCTRESDIPRWHSLITFPLSIRLFLFQLFRFVFIMADVFSHSGLLVYTRFCLKNLSIFSFSFNFLPFSIISSLALSSFTPSLSIILHHSPNQDNLYSSVIGLIYFSFFC